MIDPDHPISLFFFLFFFTFSPPPPLYSHTHKSIYVRRRSSSRDTHQTTTTISTPPLSRRLPGPQKAFERVQASERGSRARDFKGGDHISFVFFSYFLRSVVLINSRLCCALVVVIGRREKQRRAEAKVDDKDDDAREREREKCVLLFNSFYSQKFSRSFSGLTFLSEQY